MVNVDISRVSSFLDHQIKAYEDAAELWELRDTPTARFDLAHCPTIIAGGKYKPYVGKQCRHKAGQGTTHTGYGQCVAHGGAKKYGRALGAWLMAHAFAEEYDLSPWESLLYVIRITAGRVRYCERVLGTAVDDRELEGRVSSEEPMGVSESGDLTTGRDLSWWVETSERERITLAKVSKAAIDAGVAQLLVTREIEQGDLIADSYIRVYDQLEASGLDEEALRVIREAMKQELMALGTTDGTRVHHTPGMIEGGTVDK